MKLPYAESVNYWQTGRSSPDKWIADAKRLIQKAGGQILGEAFGQDGQGNAAFMLAFAIGGDNFKIVWPVLKSRTGKEQAARIQAATFLFHDVKAKCLSASILGARAAFFSYLVLPDGRAASEASTPELYDAIPEILKPNQAPQLVSGEIVEE
jgi:hypothetical protein